MIFATCRRSKAARTTLLLIFIFLQGVCYGMSSSTKPLDETSSRLARWHGRWDEKKLGWHQNEVHPIMIKYGALLTGQDSCPAPEGGLRWFVPLCGKTVDMAWLATQESTKEVIGNDGVREALDAFVKEHPNLSLVREESASVGTHERFSGKSITLLKGDFFALNETITGGKVDAVLDRASMVAIDPGLREEYVATMSRLLKPGGRILLATLEKRTGDEEAVTKGPPYSIAEDEVRRLYGGQDWIKSITLLDEIDEFAGDPDSKFKQDGVTSMFELYFLIEAKS